MTPHEKMPIGVVLECRKIDNPWQDHVWRPVAVIPGAPPGCGWKVLRQGDGWVHYHAGTLELELHRKETEGYRLNLSQPSPTVFVVLRPNEDDDETEHEVVPFHVTVCPNEALDYDDGEDDTVEAVPMPEEVMAWVQAFVDEYHVEVPFQKRKRKPYDPRKGGFDRNHGHGKDHG